MESGFDFSECEKVPPILYETIPRLVVGLLLLLFGWRLYKLGVRVIGFYFGFIAGAAVWQLVLQLTEGQFNLPQGEAANLCAGIVLGLIAAYLSFRLYNAILWIAVIGGCLYLGYSTDYFDPIYDLIARTGYLGTLQETLGDFLPGLLALLIAGIVMLLHRHVVILATAGTGAHLVSSVTPYPILFFPLLLVGCAVQIGVQRKGKSVEGD